LGVRNIRFVQADGEDLSRFPDGYFDWVQTTMFLHELSAAAMPRILAEAWRVLRPGGLMLHVEQPQYGPDMPLFEQFMRDWDAFNNNEPFWSAMHGVSMTEVMEQAGFSREEQFSIGVRAVVDTAIFPPSAAQPSGTLMARGRPRPHRRRQHDGTTGLDRAIHGARQGASPGLFR
jgi:SAM-dependent methyltransferase